MDARRARTLLLPAAFAILGVGIASCLLLAPDRLWLLFLPVFGWGALFMAWAYLKLKDPRYYG